MIEQTHAPQANLNPQPDGSLDVSESVCGSGPDRAEESLLAPRRLEVCFARILSLLVTLTVKAVVA